MEQHLTQYRIFYAVARAGNISRAAKELFISQPAISKSISKLEESLGMALFIRNSRGVSLTAEGQVLLAGENKNSYLDMGRKDAANWRDIVAISCSRSGIGALGMDGSVHLAGNIRDINRLRDTWSALQEEFHRELVTAAVHGTI